MLISQSALPAGIARPTVDAQKKRQDRAFLILLWVLAVLLILVELIPR